MSNSCAFFTPDASIIAGQKAIRSWIAPSLNLLCQASVNRGGISGVRRPSTKDDTGLCFHLARAMSPMESVAGSSSHKPTRVLMVCLGNICRSPTAEAVFQATVDKAGVAHKYSVDSCGTGGGSSDWYLPGGFAYHEGDPADPRMTRVAATRNVKLTSRSRRLTPQDLDEFDIILAMDASNVAAIQRAANHWQEKGMLSPTAVDLWRKKVALMTEFLRDPKWENFDQVPDPYYGGERGFELVLDLLEDACQGLFDAVESGQLDLSKQ